MIQVHGHDINPDKWQMACGDWYGFRVSSIDARWATIFWNKATGRSLIFHPEEASWGDALDEPGDLPITVVRWMLSETMRYHEVPSPTGLPW
jgi:hypothetical protein